MLLDILTRNKIVNYGNYKSKNNKELPFFIDNNEIVSSHGILNHFSKLLNIKINHHCFDAIMSFDFVSAIICGSLSASFNIPGLYYKEKKIIGSRLHRNIMVISLKETRELKENIEYVKSIGFNVIKVINIFEIKANEEYLNIVSYKSLIDYKDIAYFYHRDYSNCLLNNMAKLVISKRNTYCKYMSNVKEAIQYPCVYFDENNISLVDKLENTDIIKIFFKIYSIEQRDFFIEISKIYKKIDVIIIHNNYALKLLPIIKKIKKKIGVIIYFENNETEELDNYLLVNYNEQIIGTLNISKNYNHIVNFSRHIKFI